MGARAGSGQIAIERFGVAVELAAQLADMTRRAIGNLMARYGSSFGLS